MLHVRYGNGTSLWLFDPACHVSNLRQHLLVEAWNHVVIGSLTTLDSLGKSGEVHLVLQLERREKEGLREESLDLELHMRSIVFCKY
jgi:hypothetical protein